MKLTLKNPVEPFHVFQPFGVNGDYYQAHGINIIGHNGLDLVASHGQPIYAAHDGQAFYEIDDQGGHGVIVITNRSFDYQGAQCGFKTIYWHMCDSTKEPQYKSPVEGNPWMAVKAGDLIGYADSTGLSTGDHLHFGLKPVTPNEPPWAISTVNPDNGYLGAIDPAPYMGTAFIFTKDLSVGDTNEDVRKLQLKLQTLGYFPMNQICTGFYGVITKNAVYRFQIDHIPNLSLYARYISRGSYCYEQTRAALNAV